MAKPIFNFKGLMAPAFTAFNNDAKKSLNVSNVDAYARYLKSSKIPGVLVNGTTGEGPALNVSERKLLTEKWSSASKKHGLTLMVQIGGAPLVDVIELAKHAQEMKVDAILCLPELYWKPKTAQDLVNYFKKISVHCADTPLLLYHIPSFTGVTIHMPTFCDLAEEQIPNFVGLKYTSGDLEQGSACLKPGRSVLLGADQILAGALTLGFDSAIMTTLNICPELAIQIVKCIDDGRVKDAKKAQDELSQRIQQILEMGGGEWVASMKLEFDKQHPGMLQGPARA